MNNHSDCVLSFTTQYLNKNFKRSWLFFQQGEVSVMDIILTFGIITIHVRLWLHILSAVLESKNHFPASTEGCFSSGRLRDVGCDICIAGPQRELRFFSTFRFWWWRTWLGWSGSDPRYQGLILGFESDGKDS